MIGAGERGRGGAGVGGAGPGDGDHRAAAGLGPDQPHRVSSRCLVWCRGEEMVANIGGSFYQVIECVE